MNHKGISLEGNSYNTIVNSMYKFRRFSYNGREELMNIFDQPGQLFFKIFFHFDSGDDANGLLGITDIDFYSPSRDFDKIVNQSSGVSSYRDAKGDPVENQKYLSNTAFHYLLRNNEITRASMLIDFIELLSEINADYPWYWKSVTGLDTLLERKMMSEVKIDEETPKITIKCSEDAFDNRIGTLLDLYKSICFDYINKREVIPANLRKFDMDICIVQAPTNPIHGITVKNIPQTNIDYTIPNLSSDHSSYTSSKMIELKNCEIVFNSNKSGYAELTNEEGFQHEYTIDISVSDAFENRYNELLGYNIGDFILFRSIAGNNPVDDGIPDRTQFDAINVVRSKLTMPSIYKSNQDLGVLNGYPGSRNNSGASLVDVIAGTVTNKLTSYVKNRLLGNIYGLSATEVKNFIDNPAQAISNTVTNEISKGMDRVVSGSTKRNDPSSNIGKKLPGYPSSEELRAQLLSKLNANQNLVNSL